MYTEICMYVYVYINVYIYGYVCVYIYIHTYIHTYMCVYMYMHYIHLCSFLDIHIYIHIISLLPSCPTKKTWTIDTCPMTMSHVDMCARAKTHKDQIQTVFFLAMKCDHLSDPWGAVTPDVTGTIATFPSCDFVELLHTRQI